MAENQEKTTTSNPEPSASAEADTQQVEPEDQVATEEPEAATTENGDAEAEQDAATTPEGAEAEVEATAETSDLTGERQDAEYTSAEDRASTIEPATKDASEETPAGDAAPAAEANSDSPEGPDGGDGSVQERSEPPAFVNRILEDAVEKASRDIGIPTSEGAQINVGDLDDPEQTLTLDELERSESSQGFTGEVVGRTVSLDELDQYEQSRNTDPIYDQFRMLVDQTSIDVREQDIVQGRVLKVTEDDVVIDIGYKSDGIVDRGEFTRELQRGDTVEVYLERKEDRDGQLVLSKLKADKVRRWQRIEEIYENEEIIEGTIIRRIKGGMIVELFDSLEAFLPGSQIDVRPVRDFDAYLEKRMEFKIVKLNPSNENIVVSHRALIQKELEAQREKILSDLEVGQVLRGIVKNIVDFGVFIDLGGVDGLLHITDLSWGRVSHPSEIVDLDEELEVVVLDYEEERQRISLGLKQLKSHPWDNIDEKYDEGETVEGKVVSITNYGAFVELEKGIEGLVHISEMSWTRHIKHPSQMVSLGQLVDVKILNIDEEEKKISLGMKQLEPDPWDGISDRYPAGTVLTGTVRNITNFGVFVEIEPGIDGLVHISDLSWTKKVRHPSDMIKKGQELDVVILNIDEERRRISLGHKQVKTNPWDQFGDAYNEGSDTTGTVVRVEDKGLVVELPLDVEAFVPGSELKNGPRNFQNFYAEGDELELRVIRFDKGRKDIVLSETAKERQEAAAEKRMERAEQRQEQREQQRSVRDYQDRSSSEPASGPMTIGELSGLGDLRAQMQQAEAEEAAAEREAEATVETEAQETEAEAQEAEAAEAEAIGAETEAEVDAAEVGTQPGDEDSDALNETQEAVTEEVAGKAPEPGSVEADESSADQPDEEEGFPEGFPHVSRLTKAGITSLAELRSTDDFTDIEGIGSSYAEDLRNAIAELDEA